MNIKECFKNWLLGHGAWDKFVRNLNEAGKSFESIIVNAATIDRAMTWSLTPEGHAYWSRMHAEWVNFYGRRNLDDVER